MKKIKLFCIPYAGGSASIYYLWRNFLDTRIDLLPLELSGRGSRYNSPFYNSIEDAVSDVCKKILDYAFDCPFVLFGHSMGSLIVYEIVENLQKKRYPLPVHIFVSGRYPPYIQKEMEILHNLPDQQLIEETKKYGGLSDEVLNHRELLDIQVRILRNDYRILENYHPQLIHFRHNIDITALRGINDLKIYEDDMKEWQKWTLGDFRLYSFDAGHFFIREKIDEVVDVINRRINFSMNNFIN